MAPLHHGNDVDLEKLIHEEIERLPGRFRIAVVLCDLEGRTHEQAARHLGCAVGTVKSRLARGRKRLRGRLMRRGVSPTSALAAASAGSAARAAVPKGLAESTVDYAATASAVPTSVAVITEGVVTSMFVSKVKLVMTATAIVAAVAAGAVALAQSGVGRPKDKTDKPQQAGSSGWTYHILASRNGEPPRKVAVVEMTGDTPIRVDAEGAVILFQPKRDGEPGERTATAIPPDANPDRSERDQKHRKFGVTTAKRMDVDITQQYVGQIHAQQHIDINALEKGYLTEIAVNEGQAVKKGDLLFKIAPTLEKAKLDVESGNIKAPFDGIVDRLQQQVGSLVKEGDTLTTLSDNSVIWVYFNVPENRYLEYMANRKQHEENKIELMLANQTKFPQPGKIGAIDAKFNNETGNIAFRADFPNPDGLLRHGQTGTIVIHRKLHDAIVIPVRATFEIATSGTFTSSTKMTLCIGARSSPSTNWMTSMSSRRASVSATGSFSTGSGRFAMARRWTPSSVWPTR